MILLQDFHQARINGLFLNVHLWSLKAARYYVAGKHPLNLGKCCNYECARMTK